MDLHATRPVRVTSVPFLIGVLVGAALLTTIWTASSLQPVDTRLQGFRPAALSSRWEQTAEVAAAPAAARRYERVSERFFLHQLVRAFLAEGWSASSGTRRPSPAHGWAFPVADDAPEEGEDDAVSAGAGEDEGVMLSSSASALTAQRIQELAPSAARSDTPWQDASADSENENGEYRRARPWWDSSQYSADSWDRGGENGENTWDSAQYTANNVDAYTDDDGAVDHGNEEFAALGDDDASQRADTSSDEVAAEGAEATASAPEGTGVTASDVDARDADSSDAGPSVSRHAVPFAAPAWVASTGELVSVQYVGSRGSEGADDSDGDVGARLLEGLEGFGRVHATAHATPGSPYLSLCTPSTDWLCAAAKSTRKRASRFHILRARVNASAANADTRSRRAASTNAADSVGANRTGAGSSSDGGGGEWFALRSVRNLRLVQVAPEGDDEAWVVRARGEPLQRVSDASGRGWLEVGPLDLWREDGAGLRNMGTGALINFRGDAAGSDDGGAVRAHADIKCVRDDGEEVRCAARAPTSRTRFELRRTTAPKVGKALPNL